LIEGRTVRRAFLFLKGWQLILALIFVMALVLNDSAVALAEGPTATVAPSATPTRLRIPAIELDSDIVTVGSQIVEVSGRKYRQWDTSSTLVGWQQGSALLGQRGNTVLTGHSDIYTQIFRNLDQLRPGDEIIVSAGDQVYYYRVTRVIEVQETGVSMAQRVENGKWIARTDDERLTLITCSRPGASHRLIVVAYPASQLKPGYYPMDDLRLKHLK
jgi:sortase A